MRIVIAGPPKTGNVWIENILSCIYGLRILWPPDVPTNDPASFRTFVEEDQFLDQSIFHQHFLPTQAFFDIADSIDFHIVTIIRHPYDTFLSLYNYVQNFSDVFISSRDIAVIMFNKPIEHPHVMLFLEHGFRMNIYQAHEWIKTGRSNVVRYEDMHEDSFRTVKALTEKISPVENEVIAAAIEASVADVMRKRDEYTAKHISGARVGGWREQFTPKHLKIFRERHAPMIEALGYEVY